MISGPRHRPRTVPPSFLHPSLWARSTRSTIYGVSERHAGAAAHGPGGKVLAAEPADLAANRHLGAAHDIITEAAGDAGRPALDELGRQQQCLGVVAGEIVVGVNAHIGRERRRGVPEHGIGDLDAAAGAAGGKSVLGLLGAEAVEVGVIVLPDGIDFRRWLDLEPLRPGRPGESAGGEPAVARKRCRRRAGYAVVADPRARDRGIEAHA